MFISFLSKILQINNVSENSKNVRPTGRGPYYSKPYCVGIFKKYLIAYFVFYKNVKNLKFKKINI